MSEEKHSFNRFIGATMPNSLAKGLELAFETYVEAYDDDCVVSKAADKYSPDPKTMQRVQDVDYIKQNMHVGVSSGLDLTAVPLTDVMDRFIPRAFNQPDNVHWELDAKELRDDEYMRQTGKAAAERLAAEVDRRLVAQCAARATMVIRKTGAFAWEDAGTAEATMISRGMNKSQRKLFVNPFDYQAVTTSLGNRAYIGDWSKDALARSRVPDLATFQTFRTDNASNVAAAGLVTGTTVTSLTSHAVQTMAGDLPFDNRVGVIPMAGANIANIKNGDCFTIAGVSAVHMIDKTDTLRPMTFRVISGGGTANPSCSPPIYSSGPYQNVNASAAASAAITFLNTVTAPANIFWAQGAVQIGYGRLEWPRSAGVDVKTATTVQGVPLAMISSMSARTGKLYTRFTTMYSTVVPDPEKVGIILCNQV